MSEVSKDTVGKLKDVILKQADEQRRVALEGAQSKADEWLAAETDRLNKKCEIILSEAKKNAEAQRSRRLKSAARKNSGEYLKLQNSLLDSAVQSLEQKLAELKESPDYSEILCGMAISAAKQLHTDKIIISLCKEDMTRADKLVSQITQTAKGLSVAVDTNAAPISGGLIATDASGRRRVPYDWHNVALELSGTLAEKLFADR